MRVHDEVGDDAHVTEGHVLLVDDETTYPLLAVAGRKLVSNLGAAYLQW